MIIYYLLPHSNLIPRLEPFCPLSYCNHPYQHKGCCRREWKSSSPSLSAKMKKEKKEKEKRKENKRREKKMAAIYFKPRLGLWIYHSPGKTDTLTNCCFDDAGIVFNEHIFPRLTGIPHLSILKCLLGLHCSNYWKVNGNLKAPGDHLKSCYCQLSDMKQHSFLLQNNALCINIMSGFYIFFLAAKRLSAQKASEARETSTSKKDFIDTG